MEVGLAVNVPGCVRPRQLLSVLSTRRSLHDRHLLRQPRGLERRLRTRVWLLGSRVSVRGGLWLPASPKTTFAVYFFFFHRLLEYKMYLLPGIFITWGHAASASSRSDAFPSAARVWRTVRPHESAWFMSPLSPSNSVNGSPGDSSTGLTSCETFKDFYFMRLFELFKNLIFRIIKLS